MAAESSALWFSFTILSSSKFFKKFIIKLYIYQHLRSNYLSLWQYYSLHKTCSPQCHSIIELLSRLTKKLDEIISNLRIVPIWDVKPEIAYSLYTYNTGQMTDNTSLRWVTVFEKVATPHLTTFMQMTIEWQSSQSRIRNDGWCSFLLWGMLALKWQQKWL